MLSPSASGNENLLCLAPRLEVTKLVMLSPSASEEVGEGSMGKLLILQLFRKNYVEVALDSAVMDNCV